MDFFCIVKTVLNKDNDTIVINVKLTKSSIKVNPLFILSPILSIY